MSWWKQPFWKHLRMQPWAFLFEVLTHLAVVKEAGRAHSFYLNTCLEQRVVLKSYVVWNVKKFRWNSEPFQDNWTRSFHNLPMICCERDLIYCAVLLFSSPYVYIRASRLTVHSQMLLDVCPKLSYLSFMAFFIGVLTGISVFYFTFLGKVGGKSPVSLSTISKFYIASWFLFCLLRNYIV